MELSMKCLTIILTILFLSSVFAVDTVTLQGWVSPSYNDYDFRCINMDQEHYRYKWLVHAKFFNCPEVLFAKEYDYECISVMISNSQADLITRMTLTRAIWNPAEEFLASLDLINRVYYFDINYVTLQPQINDISIAKTRDLKHTWGYDAGIIFQNADDVVSGFPAICQFKNHFPEEG